VLLIFFFDCEIGSKIVVGLGLFLSCLPLLPLVFIHDSQYWLKIVGYFHNFNKVEKNLDLRKELGIKRKMEIRKKGVKVKNCLQGKKMGIRRKMGCKKKNGYMEEMRIRKKIEMIYKIGIRKKSGV